ncbi:hypothetical protein CR513_42866, partial [Mucuna pruriens]
MRGNVMYNFDMRPIQCNGRKLIDFDNEPRNLRISLITYGMNLDLQPASLVVHEAQVYDVIYDDFGLRQLGNDIDVYLSPLVEDLRMLWDKDIDVFDEYNNQNCQMCVLLFCTTNDFSAYGNLFKYSVKGHKICPICEEGTSYHQLTHGRKTCYLKHRKFFKANHSYR